MTGEGNAADYFIARHLREGRGDRIADAHLRPVVTKFFAAIQTYDIGRVALAGSRRETGFPHGRDGERRPPVRASQ